MSTFRTAAILALALGTTLSKSRADWEKEVKEHNDKSKHNHSWEAGLAADIPYEDDDALRSMAGAIVDESDKGDNGNNNNNGNGNGKGHRLLQTALPVALDLRTKFPKCWSIGYIRNQGQCGSCWAVSSMSSLSDRFCIAYSTSTTTVQRSFSYEDPLECCTNCGFASQGGCNGGYITGGFSFTKSSGTVRGENYGNTTSCKPYFLSPTVTTSQTARACSLKCSNTTTNAATIYTADKRKLLSYFVYTNASNSTATTVNNIKTALTLRGTVVAGMTVYSCFYSYKSGVYTRTSSTSYGGHAIRLIGWGVYNSTLSYWIGANSWGTNWGLSGFFWIKMGSNEAGIESYVVEGNFK